MNRASLTEQVVIRLARFVAGPERRAWLDAMEAELDHLTSRRLDWVLGSLVAAVKDRWAREWPTLALFAAIPASTAAAVVPVTAIAQSTFSATGISPHLLGPVLLPLPFLGAVLLGLARPWRRPVITGLLGFALYQAGPSAFMHFAWGSSFGLWAPNLAQYGVHPAISVAATFTLWSLGAALGVRVGNQRRDSRSPEPLP